MESRLLYVVCGACTRHKTAFYAAVRYRCFCLSGS